MSTVNLFNWNLGYMFCSSLSICIILRTSCLRRVTELLGVHGSRGGKSLRLLIKRKWSAGRERRADPRLSRHWACKGGLRPGSLPRLASLGGLTAGHHIPGRQTHHRATGYHSQFDLSDTWMPCSRSCSLTKWGKPCSNGVIAWSGFSHFITTYYVTVLFSLS